MTIRSRIFALTYDHMIAKTESAGLAAHRAGLLNGVTGRVLEIGGGTGVNLVHYGSGLESLTVTEPEYAMLKRSCAATAIARRWTPCAQRVSRSARSCAPSCRVRRRSPARWPWGARSVALPPRNRQVSVAAAARPAPQ